MKNETTSSKSQKDLIYAKILVKSVELLHIYNVQLSQLTYVMKHLFSTIVDVDTLVYADVIIDMLSFIDQNKFNILTPTQTRELLSFACTI